MKRTHKEPSAKGQSFWQTAPGLITAVAALLTAIGGCVALFTTNPRLLDLILKPSATATVAVSQAPVGSAPSGSTSTTAVAPGAILASRPVQFPDGQVVAFIDPTGHTHTYTILSATLNSLPPNQMMLDLKVRVSTNNGVLFTGSSFSLSVGGQQIGPSNFVDVFVNANETSDADLQIPLDPSVSQATLTVTLPIDMPNNAKQLRLLFPAAGTSIVPAATPAGLAPRAVQLPDGPVVTFIDVLGHTHRYTILSATLDPLPPSLMLLDLKIRVSTDNGINFTDASFRLSVGDQMLKPSSIVDVFVNANETADGDIKFQLDPSVKAATLTIYLPLDEPNNSQQLRLAFP